MEYKVIQSTTDGLEQELNGLVAKGYSIESCTFRFQEALFDAGREQLLHPFNPWVIIASRESEKTWAEIRLVGE